MRQAIHILRKDVRHCWPYIAVALALAALDAWHLSYRYMPDRSKGETNPYELALYVVWWLAIGVTIHQESLTGDRQFWVTRPYSWKSLLAAKLLFPIATLVPPLLFSDCIMLHSAGYNPLALIPLLLWRQLCFLAGFGLLFVVGALTRRTSELVLAYLLVLVATIATLLGFSAFGFRSFLLPHPDGPSLIVTLAPWMVSAVALLLVVFYYARRQTAGIRSLTIAFAVLAPVVGGWSEASAIRKFAWPPEVRSDPWCQGAKVELDAAPADERMMKVGDYQGMLCIPVKCSGWPRDLMSYNVRSASISLTKPKEYGRWGISANNPFFRTDIFPGHEFIRLSLDELAREAPPGAKETPAELKLSVDLSLYRRVATVALPQNGQPAYVPGWGNVQLLVNDRGAHVVRLSALRPAERDWRYGLGNARSVTVVNAEWSGTMVDRDVSPISFRLSPVYTYVAEFVMPSGPPPLVFTANRLVGLGNCQLAIPQVRLADYATGRP